MSMQYAQPAALKNCIELHLPRLTDMDPALWHEPYAPSKWTRLEVLGHLCDSAINNHRRFVQVALENNYIFAEYDQNAWVDAHNYTSASADILIALWSSLNYQILAILNQMNADKLDNRVEKHNFMKIAWERSKFEGSASVSDYLLDYIAHLEHHLHQILD